MKKKETCFNYVYQNLKTRILEQQIPIGGKLPSSRTLCRELNVGMYTVNNVLNALKEEGLIEIQPRRVPVVLQPPAPRSTAELEVLRQRDNLRQLYRTLTLTLPSMLAFALQKCSVRTMSEYKNAAKSSQYRLNNGSWRPQTHYLREVLGNSGNYFLTDLLSFFELNGNFVFFAEQCPIFLMHYHHDKYSKTLFQCMNEQDSALLIKHLTNFFQKLSQAVEKTLVCLEEKYATNLPEKAPTITWNLSHGKNHLYLQIIEDIITKICHDEYPGGFMLPHERELADEYHVSVYTVRKALAYLCKIGYCHTQKGKGTFVLTDIIHTSTFPSDSDAREDAITYLQALQLITILSYPSALSAATNLKKEDFDLLSKHYQTNAPFFFDIFTPIILERMELPLMQDILTKLRQTTNWSHFFHLHYHRKSSTHILNHLTHQAYRHLQAGDYFSFAKLSAECWYYIFNKVKTTMVTKYKITAARDLHAPDILP